MVTWGARRVGSLFQWLRFGVAFLDHFSGEEGDVVLMKAGATNLLRVSIPAKEKWEVHPAAFLASRSRPPAYRRSLEFERVVFQGRMSRLLYEGEGEVWLVGRPALLELDLAPGQSITVPDSCIAAYPATHVSRSVVANPPLLVILGRGAFLTRLENTNEEKPITVYLQAHGSSRAASLASGGSSNAFGNAVDVADLLKP